VSIYSDVVDAWMADLVANVSGLSTAIQHKYAPWSPEEFYTEGIAERHVAVWPELDAEVTEPLTTAGDRMSTQTYAVAVWEDASDTQGRLQDDDTANAAWLTLAEGIRARLMRSASFQLGSASVMSTDYLGTQFDRSGTLRVLRIGFRCRVPLVRS